MVIDTSAIVAILVGEPLAPRLEAALAADVVRLVSAASVVEAAIVIEARFGDAGGRELDMLLHVLAVEIVAIDAAQADVARGALRRFGKGRHPAALNFGDSFAYALSLVAGEPLLFAGEDFSRTDVMIALPAG